MESHVCFYSPPFLLIVIKRLTLLILLYPVSWGLDHRLLLQFLSVLDTGHWLSGAIERDAKGRAIRWISPDSVVTMDYREDRLNVHLAVNRVIERFNCG